MAVQSKRLPPSTSELHCHRYPRKLYLWSPQVRWPQTWPIGIWCSDIARIDAELTHPYVYKAGTSFGSATPSDQANLQSTAGSGRLAKQRFYILVAPVLSISTDPNLCPYHPKIEPYILIWWSKIRIAFPLVRQLRAFYTM